jgi:DNA polymerase-1
MSKLLIIDGDFLLWRAVFSKGEATSCQEVLNYLFKLFNKFVDYHPIIFWDSGKPRLRSTYFKKYKSNRDKLKSSVDLELIKNQKNVAIELLECLGIRSIFVEGVEADDLISIFSEYFSKFLGYDDIYIISRDKDLRQLISSSIKIYDPISTEKVHNFVINDVSFESKEKYLFFRSMCGDPSDNLSGVKGIGPKRAEVILNKVSSFNGLIEDGFFEKNCEDKYIKKLYNNFDMLRQVYQLSKLPTFYELLYYFNSNELLSLKKCLEKKLDSNVDKFYCLSDSLVINYNIRTYYPFNIECEYLLKYIDSFIENPLVIHSLKDLDKNIISCVRCPLRSCNSCRLPVGRVGCTAVIINSTPVLGTTKALFDDFLVDTGLCNINYWHTSVCKCLPDPYRPLSFGEINACLPFLRREIELLKPKFVVAFGDEAANFFVNLGFSSDKRGGEVIKLNKFGLIFDLILVPDLVYTKYSESGKVNFSYACECIKEYLVDFGENLKKD